MPDRVHVLIRVLVPLFAIVVSNAVRSEVGIALVIVGQVNAVLGLFVERVNFAPAQKRLTLIATTQLAKPVQREEEVEENKIGPDNAKESRSISGLVGRAGDAQRARCDR